LAAISSPCRRARGIQPKPQPPSPAHVSRAARSGIRSPNFRLQRCSGSGGVPPIVRIANRRRCMPRKPRLAPLRLAPTHTKSPLRRAPAPSWEKLSVFGLGELSLLYQRVVEIVGDEIALDPTPQKSAQRNSSNGVRSLA
jgi:hypothetical protein